MTHATPDAASSPTTPSPAPEPLPAGRWPAIDVARGAALVAMAIYHATWDLAFFGLIAPETPSLTGWKLFANGIAASFLALVGVGFAMTADRPLDIARYGRRLAMIVAAAAAVTAGTLYAVPDAPVRFGILHCIAAMSILILPVRRWPALAVGGIGAAMVALPALWRTELFDHPAWLWLGLSSRVLPAVDHVPILPWGGFVLLGFAAARLVLAHGGALAGRLAAWRPGRPAGWLGLAGRHSLAVYLIHQPVLMGLIYVAAALSAPRLDAETREFRSACEMSCRAGDRDRQSCERLCSCSSDRLKAEGLWRDVLANRLDGPKQARVDAIVAACLRP